MGQGCRVKSEATAWDRRVTIRRASSAVDVASLGWSAKYFALVCGGRVARRAPLKRLAIESGRRPGWFILLKVLGSVRLYNMGGPALIDGTHHTET